MALPSPFVTPEEYLRRERAAETKSEYFNGRIFPMGEGPQAMAGAKRAHVRLTGNILAALTFALRDRPCEPFAMDMRVKVNETGLYTYPDVSVVCGEPQFEDEVVDTLLNPTVIIEVLSPSTEAYDRGEKFAHYERMESVREILLVSQDRVRIERFSRLDEGKWLREAFTDPAGELPLDSIDVRLPIAQIYERVPLPENPGR